MPDRPHIVRWTAHALVKAETLGITRADVEAAILEGHRQRSRNPLGAAWLIRRGRLAIAYDHPDGDDPTAARIVTLWRR